MFYGVQNFSAGYFKCILDDNRCKWKTLLVYIALNWKARQLKICEKEARNSMTNLKYKFAACFFWGGQMYGFHPALKRLCNQRLFVWPRLEAQT